MSSIRAKLLFALATNLILLGALGLFSLRQTNAMHDTASLLHEQVAPARAKADQINLAVNQYRTLQLEFMVNASNADRSRVEKLLARKEAEVGAYLTEYAAYLGSPQERALLDDIAAQWARFVSMTHEQFIPKAHQASSGSVNPYLSRTDGDFQRIATTLQQLTQENQSLVEESVGVFRTNHAQTNQFILSVMLGALLISGLSGISLIWSLTRNIRVLKAATAGVAAGELDREVEIRSRDEIGALARDFNQMIRTLSVQRRMVELRNGELQEGVATQRQLAEELAVARDRAEHAHEVRAQLIASIQHELHAPIKQIIAMAQLLSNERMGPLSELQQKLQANIVAGAQRVLRLMGELLEVARGELATGQLERREIALPRLVEEVMPIARRLLAEQRLSLRVSIPPDVPPVLGDASRLREVLLTLISNAARFTEQGGILIYATPHGGDSVRIAVQDSGVGIEHELQVRLRATLAQRHDLTAALQGAERGLVLSKRMVELHGGRIWFESEPGQGTTFYFTIPAAERLPAALETSSPALPMLTSEPGMVEDGAQRRRSRPVLRPALGDG